MSDDRIPKACHRTTRSFGPFRHSFDPKIQKKMVGLFCVHQPAMIDTATGYVDKDALPVSWLGQILAQINSKPLVVNKVSPDFKDNPKELQNVRDTINLQGSWIEFGYSDLEQCCIS